jgi:uncharacterized protein YukE
MAEYIGQIPEEVDALAGEFEAKAGELEDLKTAISAKIAGTTWSGPDRDRFEADWEGALSQTVTQMVQQLRAASQAASANAQEQRDASNS